MFSRKVSIDAPLPNTNAVTSSRHEGGASTGQSKLPLMRGIGLGVAMIVAAWLLSSLCNVARCVRLPC